MIAAIEDYFAKGCGRCDRFATPACSTRRWARGLAELRRICRDAGLAETVKWGHPCYMHAGRNVAILGAFRDDYRLTFLDAALLADPDRVLERQGPNARHPGTIRFRDDAQAAEREALLRAYLREAMTHAEQGLRAPREERALDLPSDLLAALDADPGLARAFGALTPGRQRSYVLALASARRPGTRIARIVAFRDRILAGKGATER